jgi:hypothetical protein
MKWFWNTFFANRAAAWTALATVALTIFSGLLWKVSDRANETSIISQRAFLTNNGPAIIKIADGPKLKGLNFVFAVSNSGTTPAKNAISEQDVAFWRTGPQKGFNFEDLPQVEKVTFVLGPKASFQLNPMFVSIEQLESVAQGKYIIFWGWFTYRDIFNNTPLRLSEFCLEINNVTWAKTDHTDASGDVFLVYPPCPTHNCYDEDCEDYAKRTQ